MSSPGADLYRTYQRYRAASAVHYDAAANRWVISRRDDIRRAALDVERFSNQATFGLNPRVSDLMKDLFPNGLPDRASTLLNSDPPEHAERRRRMSGIFGPAHVKRRRAAIRAIVDELIDSFASAGTADLVNQFAQRLSARVIGSILGFERTFSERLPTYIDSRLSLYRPDLSDDEINAALQVHREYCDGIRRHIVDHLSAPRDDLLTQLIAVWPTRGPDGTIATDPELFAMVNGMALGGQETTANLIAIAVHEAGRRPGLLRRVAETPELIPDLVEEALRYRSPVLGTNRTTRCPVTVHGTTIPAGSRVQLLWASANHDDPDEVGLNEFDIDRPRSGHLSFGLGHHHCIGAPLARLEATIALERLLARLPNLRLVEAESVPYVQSPIVYGPAHLLVSWDC